MGSYAQTADRVDHDEIVARMHANWAAYYQLPLHERELVDDKRVIPVPELRLLLRMWHRGQI